MSKKAINKNNETNSNSIAGTLKTENYMTSLQHENNILNSEIKKLNDVVIKLKSQLTNYETEKKNLLLNSNKKENDLKEVKKKLTQTKKEVEDLKQKMDISLINQTKNVEELKSKNDILQKYKNENQTLLGQLQKKNY
jgi:chromosome segregation ATPase